MDAIRAHPNNDRVEDIPNCDRTSYNYDAQNCNRNMQRREQAEERDRRQENELLGFGFVRHCSVREGVITAANVSRAVNCLADASLLPYSGLRLSIRR